MATCSSFLFIRHGETAYNLRGVRCGGDVDIPLTERGLEQALAAGETLARAGHGIDAIFASPLQRTRQTAALIAEALGGPPVIDHPGLAERHLGRWNGMSIDATQPMLDRGEAPPGGEAEEDFRRRIGQALLKVIGSDRRMPLLVSSKGVARVTGLLMSGVATASLGNASVQRFEVTEAALFRLAGLA